MEHLGDNRLLHSDLPRVSDSDRVRLARYALREGDIVVSRVGSVDRRALVHKSEEGWLFSGRCLRIRPDPTKINPDYLSWMLGAPNVRETLRRIAFGATMPSLNTKLLSDLSILVPPMHYQEWAASIFRALDNKIDLNRRITQLLDAATMTAYRRVTDQSQSSVPIDAVAAIRGGSTPSTASPILWSPGIHPWATPKDMSALLSPVLWRTGRSISDAGLESVSSGLLPEGTVLLSSRAPIGYVAIAAMPVAINQGFIALVPNAKLSSEYLCCWIRANMTAIKALANGTTFMEVSKQNFRTLRVALPPYSVLSEFDSLARPAFQLILNLERQNDRLGDLRDRLLPKLTYGDLASPEVERLMGSVV